MPRQAFYPPLLALLWLLVALGELLFPEVPLGEVALAGAIATVLAAVWWPTRHHHRVWAFTLLLLSSSLALQPFHASPALLVSAAALTLPAVLGRSWAVRALGLSGLALVVAAWVIPQPLSWAWLVPAVVLAAPIVAGVAFGLLAGLVLFRRAGAFGLAAAALGAFGVTLLHALSPSAQFNGLMVVYLVLFILATTVIASAVTFLFVKSLEYLSDSLLLALAWLSPILLGPAFFLYKALGAVSFLEPLSKAALAAVAAALTILGIWAVLAGLKMVGRLLAGRQLVADIAWKFLRSQRQVLTFRTHGLLALRALVPSTQPAPKLRLLLQVLVPLCAVVASVPLSAWYSIEPTTQSLIQMAVLGVVTAWLAFSSFRPAPFWAGMAQTLVALVCSGWMVVRAVHSHLTQVPTALAVTVALALLPALVLLIRCTVRMVLHWKHKRGLPRSLDPALSPPIVTRIAMGVGPSMFVSLVGVAIGVWALILVLSVMSGFSNELRQRIIKAKDHIMVKVKPGVDRLENPSELAAAVASLPGVTHASPYVEGEAMMSGEINVSPTVTIRGIDPSNGGLDFLYQILVAGDPDFLAHPETLLPFPGMQESAPPPLLPLPEMPLPEDENDDSSSEAPIEMPAGAPSDRKDGALDADSTEEPDDESDDAAPSLNADGLVAMPDPAGEEEMESDPVPQTVDLQLLPGIVIGRELARALSAPPGTVIQVISPDGDVGPMGVQPRARPFRVAGIFQTGMYEYDLKTGFVLLSEAQRFFNLGNDIGYLDVRLEDTSKATAIAGQIESLLEGRQAEVLTWEKMNSNLFSALKLEQIIMFCVLGFIIIIASFNIISSLILLIRRRRSAIAILRTMGAGPRHITSVFLLLGFSAGLFGTFSGVLLGVLSSGLIEYLGITLPKEYYVKSIPVLITGWQVGLVAAASTVVTGLAALYPGRVGSRVGIVEGLKDEA